MTEQTTFSMGGQGGNAFSFGPVGTQPGVHVSGIVLHGEERQSTDFKTNAPETWDDGRPKMQYVVKLQTELRDPQDAADDGIRYLYLDGRRKPNDNGTKSRICAVLDAVREAKGDTNLEYGAKLTVQWVSGVGNTGDPRNYAAWYERPTMAMTAPPAAVQHVNTPTPPPAWTAPPQPPASVAPPVAPPVAQPQLPFPAPPVQQGPLVTGGIITPPVAPPAAAPAQTLPPLTAEAVAGLQAAGVDPAVYYGPNWQALVQPA